MVRNLKSCIVDMWNGYSLSHQQFGGIMKVGDLVKYNLLNCFGIIIDCDDPDCKNPEFYVHWIGLGSEWRFADEMEVLDGSR